MLKNLCLTALFALIASKTLFSQSCTPQGDQITYGTGDVWIGYVYDDRGFINYRGYINAGTPGDLSFATHFNGPYAPITTNGCTIDAENFSVRYKLQKTFAPGYYEIQGAGDDIIRVSIDGGATWLINNWVYNNYNVSTATIFLSGTYPMVIEYEEGAHNNRIYFSVKQECAPGAIDVNEFGTNNIWRGYVYKGTAFDQLKGYVTEGTTASLNFTQNFGGSSVLYPTSDCPVETDFFSVRYRLQKNFPYGSYTFTVSGDDKFRLSLTGGASWIIDRWNSDFGNITRTYTTNLNGNYDLIMDYYDRDSSNEIGISVARNFILAVSLSDFRASRIAEGINLNWTVEDPGAVASFSVERSEDAVSFASVKAIAATGNLEKYNYVDHTTAAGKKYYYRLKITESTGEISYSKIIMVGNQVNETRIYPTINLDGYVNVAVRSATGKARLHLADLQGREVTNMELPAMAAGESIQVFIRDHAGLHGWYIARLTGDGAVIKAERLYFP